ncbi:hypothetical protein ACVJBD_001134 [Rhizobium mongolense]
MTTDRTAKGFDLSPDLAVQTVSDGDLGGKRWWARRDSNPQPSGYEPPALTIELQALTWLCHAGSGAMAPRCGFALTQFGCSDKTLPQ